MGKNNIQYRILVCIFLSVKRVWRQYMIEIVYYYYYGTYIGVAE